MYLVNYNKIKLKILEIIKKINLKYNIFSNIIPACNSNNNTTLLIFYHYPFIKLNYPKQLTW